MAEISALLRQPGVRLVTLIGPGGVGKTRLALRVAAALAAGFPDGVAFVPLAPVTDPDLVAPTILQALGVLDRSVLSPLETLAAALRGREMLLVLDNLEQVAPAAPQLSWLLAACPDLTLLVTSRILLRLSGEHAYPVRPLELPQISGSHVQEGADALQLFVDRAHAANPAFTLSPQNAHVVAAICQRLDGLPLALELVAAKVRLLPPQALLPRLAQALPLLTNGRRDDPARLRTMHDAIAWSYDLLTPDDQRLYARLAIFHGDFTLEAAAGVALAGDTADAAAVLAGVESLLEQSLLHQIAAPGRDAQQEPRFGMLETVREFGLAQLEGFGDATLLRHQHAGHFLEMAERVSPGLWGPRQQAALIRLDADLANLRAAMAWLIEHRDAARALRLALALARYWYLRGRFAEAHTALASALALADDQPPAIRAAALIQLCCMEDWQGSYERATALGEEAVSMQRALGNARALAEALMMLSGAYMQVDVARSEALAEECRVLCATIGQDLHWAEAMEILGICAYARGDRIAARTLMLDALQIARRAADPDVLGSSLGDLGHVCMVLGRHDESRGYLREALALFQTVGNRYWIAWCISSVAGQLARTEPERAVMLHAAADTMRGDVAPLRPFVQVTYDAIFAEVQLALGDAAFTAARERGHALTMAEAIAETEAIIATPAIAPAPAPAPFGLTPREREVLRLMAAGHANHEIAGALFISVPTVKRHASTILGKLGATSRAAAVAIAHGNGLA
ncbi:MAG: LuxR C-terminal-related transcriptional regulator [Thermomicrobiales bacterium]